MSTIKEGALVKKALTLSKNNWKHRYFILTPHELRYYSSAKLTKLKGSVALAKGDTVEECSAGDKFSRPNTLKVVTKANVLYLTAPDAATMGSWLSAIRSVVAPEPEEKKEEAADPKPAAMPTSSSAPKPAGISMRFSKSPKKASDSKEGGDLNRVEGLQFADMMEEEQEEEKTSGINFLAIVRKARQRIPRLFTWGNNSDGQAGDGKKHNTGYAKAVLVQALRLKNAPYYVASGDGHVAILTEAGNVFAWGDGRFGQLGISERCKNSTRPYLLKELRKKTITYIACGSTFTLAVDSLGNSYSWGTGSCGQLGQGPEKEVLYAPTQIETISKVKKMYAGSVTAGAEVADGSVYVWGCNATGQLARSTSNDVWKPEPLSLAGVSGAVKQIALGSTFSAFLTNKGAAYITGVLGEAQQPLYSKYVNESEERVDVAVPAGKREEGSIEGANVAEACTPRKVEVEGEVLDVSAGRFQLIVSTKKRVYAAGYGYLGVSTHDVREKPEPIPELDGEGIVTAACGDGFTIVRSDDGRLYAWGIADFGQLNLGVYVSMVKPILCRQEERSHYKLITCGRNFAAGLNFRGAKGRARALQLAKKYSSIWRKKTREATGKNTAVMSTFIGADSKATDMHELDGLVDTLTALHGVGDSLQTSAVSTLLQNLTAKGAGSGNAPGLPLPGAAEAKAEGGEGEGAEAGEEEPELPEGWMKEYEDGQPFYLYKTGDWQWSHPAYGVKFDNLQQTA